MLVGFAEVAFFPGVIFFSPRILVASGFFACLDGTRGVPARKPEATFASS